MNWIDSIVIGSCGDEQWARRARRPLHSPSLQRGRVQVWLSRGGRYIQHLLAASATNHSTIRPKNIDPPLIPFFIKLSPLGGTRNKFPAWNKLALPCASLPAALCQDYWRAQFTNSVLYSSKSSSNLVTTVHSKWHYHRRCGSFIRPYSSVILYAVKLILLERD